MTREYVIFDFTEWERGDECPPGIRFYTEESLFDWIDKNRDKEFTVYRLGECLIDWS